MRAYVFVWYEKSKFSIMTFLYITFSDCAVGRPAGTPHIPSICHSVAKHE